jgi:uncharacterized membrane protein
MAICSKCGSQLAEGVKFCDSCGASTEAPGGAPGVTGSPNLASGASQGGIAPNVAAMLTYLPLCFVGLVCAILFGLVLDPYKKNHFIRFHAWQSLAIHVAVVVFWIGWTIVSMLVAAIIHFLAFILAPISLLIGLGVLVLMVFLMVKAHGNQTFKVPVLGDWADKQAGKAD